MSNAWVWDQTLFAGTARHYQRGRLPYSADMARVLQQTLALDGRGRLLDVGSGPGTVALALADLFEEVVGLDPDQAKLDEAVTNAAKLGISNSQWVRLRAEALPADLGTFRVAVFGQSFHWMDRERVAAAIFEMLEPGGAFLHVNQEATAGEAGTDSGPTPPYDAIKLLIRSYIGDVRRAGQGFLPQGMPDKEADIIESVGFDKEKEVRIAGGKPWSVRSRTSWIRSFPARIQRRTSLGTGWSPSGMTSLTCWLVRLEMGSSSSGSLTRCCGYGRGGDTIVPVANSLG
jgi:SAM-dependent methyltransferase